MLRTTVGGGNGRVVNRSSLLVTLFKTNCYYTIISFNCKPFDQFFAINFQNLGGNGCERLKPTPILPLPLLWA